MVQWCQADLSSNNLLVYKFPFPPHFKDHNSNEVQFQLILFWGLD